MTRRTFLAASAAASVSTLSPTKTRRLFAAASDDGPEVRPNILYGLTTGSWGLEVPPGEPLPLLRILDETVATGFNGIRLTGFPRILEDNDLTTLALEEALEKRGLRFSTISFGGFYRDRAQQPKILDDLRTVMEIHQHFGATEATFFPSTDVKPDEDEAEVYRVTFDFYRRMGQMALEEYGVRMGVHNLPGSLISTQKQIDRFLANTDPRYVFCAWDTAHLLLDGCDSLGTIRRSLDRIVYLDFEDATLHPSSQDFVAPNGRRFAGDSARGEFYNSSMDLGKGEIDYPAIMQILKDGKYRGWIVPDLHAVRVSARESWRIAMDYITTTLDPIYQ